MALIQRLEMRQGQSLVMTPQLQQAIKLLQLSNIELGAYVEQELERNPLLERDELVTPDQQESARDDSSETMGEPLDTALSREDFSKAADIDVQREDLYGRRHAATKGARDGA